MSVMFQKLELLKGTSIVCRIRVRITRMWSSIANNGNFMYTNMILLDSEDYHVHAFVYPDVWNAFQNLLFEGNVYDFTNFITREATGRLRPVSTGISIVLTSHTTAQPVPLEVTTIPRHKFEITPIGELYDLAMSYVADETPLYAVDLVGVVQAIEPVRVINTHNGQRSFLSFLFYDGRHSVKVTFFDEKIASLDPILQGYFETRPIVVLSTLRLSMFKGLIQVNSLSSSRVFFNIDYQPVTVLRHRLLNQLLGAPANAA